MLSDGEDEDDDSGGRVVDDDDAGGSGADGDKGGDADTVTTVDVDFVSSISTVFDDVLERGGTIVTMLVIERSEDFGGS